MLSNILYFLPCIVCILWAMLFFLKRKNVTQRLYFMVLLLGSFYFLTYAFYISPWTDYDFMVKLDVVNLPLALALLALNIIYVHTHHSDKLLHSHGHLLLFLPSVLMLSATILVYSMIGFDEASRYTRDLDDMPLGEISDFDSPVLAAYYYIDIYVFRIIALLMILLVLADCIYILRKEGYRFGNFMRFFFRGLESTPTRAVCMLDMFTFLAMIPLASLGRSYMINSPHLGATLSVIIAILINFLSFVEYMSSFSRILFRDLTHIGFEIVTTPLGSDAPPSFDNVQPAESQPVSLDEPQSAEPKPAKLEELQPAESKPAAIDPRLLTALVKAFDEDCVYLDSELTIVSLAQMLQTNRTTLSYLINMHFGMPFRQLVAQYRIEMAKNYMLQHPESTQDTVAVECGFSTAQAFNMKFKELTGESPRVWLTRQ